MNPKDFKSAGDIIICNIKLKHRIDNISGDFSSKYENNITNNAQIKARNKEGETPANQTNNINVKNLIVKFNFFLLDFFPINIAIPENIDKCIPDNARI